MGHTHVDLELARRLGLLWLSLALLASCDLPAATNVSPFLRQGGLCPRVLSADTRRPALISVLINVEDCEGNPVTGLTIQDFQIFENDNPVSVFESQSDIFPMAGTFEAVNILLLDLSGSVVRAERSLDVLKSAALQYVETVLDSSTPTHEPYVAIYWFDGARNLGNIAPFTQDRDALRSAISSLSPEVMRDDSTNLYGSIEDGLEVIKLERRRRLSSGVEAVLGSVVLFTDGTDRAQYSTLASAKATVESVGNDYLIQTIGLGGEIDRSSLQDLGRDGFQFVENLEGVTSAFEGAARRVSDEVNSVYLVRYCSPLRAGSASLIIRVGADSSQGEVQSSFSGDNFGPGCDPNDASGEQLEVLTRSQNTSDTRDMDADLPDVPELTANENNRALASGDAAALRTLLFENNCNRPIEMAIRYLDSNDQWQTVQWWTIEGNSPSITLSHDGSKIVAKGPEMFIFARIEDSDYTWQALSDEPQYSTTLTALSGERLDIQMRWIPLLETETINGIDYWEFGVSCSNYVPGP